MAPERGHCLTLLNAQVDYRSVTVESYTGACLIVAKALAIVQVLVHPGEIPVNSQTSLVPSCSSETARLMRKRDWGMLRLELVVGHTRRRLLFLDYGGLDYMTSNKKDCYPLHYLRLRLYCEMAVKLRNILGFNIHCLRVEDRILASVV
jgi:hypothetical protein